MSSTLFNGLIDWASDGSSLYWWGSTYKTGELSRSWRASKVSLLRLEESEERSTDLGERSSSLSTLGFSQQVVDRLVGEACSLFLSAYYWQQLVEQPVFEEFWRQWADRRPLVWNGWRYFMTELWFFFLPQREDGWKPDEKSLLRDLQIFRTSDQIDDPKLPPR